jgi:DNA-binding MarR family transcriptional regulator
MPAMPSGGQLTETQERILLTLWRMKGVGKNRIREESLKVELGSDQSSDLLTGEIMNLQIGGFLERIAEEDQSVISLTPLGLAILRQLEEDKLQELK